MKKLITSSLLCMAFASQAADITPLALSKTVDLQKQYWITLGQDAVADLSRVGAKEFLMPSAVAAQNSSSVSVAQITEGQLSSLSRMMHENHKRCGGYVVHDSLQAALTAQQTTVVPSVFTTNALNEQAAVNALLPNVDKQNILDTITYLSTTFVNRFYTTAAGVAASNGLANMWGNMVTGVSYASVSQFTHSQWAQKSVVLSITGSERPDEWVVIGGHLDSTIGYNTGENSFAPGADDDASGIATLTEVMRVFLQNGQPKRSIKFIGYAAEEVGLRGSKEIAETEAANGVDVVGVMQLDMTNYAGASEDIVFITDYTSATQNAYLTGILDEYLPAVNYSFDSCGYGCSDHASWYASGYPASMPFEAPMNSMNPYIHTTNDTLANMDTSGNHALNFAKLGLAYAIELANADAIEPPPVDSSLDNGVPVTDLAEQSGASLEFTLEVPADSTDITFNMSGGSGDADLYVKQGSVPSHSSFDCRPYASGNNENCAMGAGSGTYHVVLKAYSSFTGVTLVGSFTEGSDGGGGDGGGDGELPVIDVTHTGVAVASNAWVNYTQVLEAGYSSLNVSLSGGTGDADLHVNFGSQSTGSNWDCRPYSAGNNENCSFNSPAAGTWYIDVNGYSSSAGMTLNWTAAE